MADNEHKIVSNVVRIAADTLIHDLMNAYLAEVRNAPDQWHALDETEQQAAIDRTHVRIRTAVLGAIEILSGSGFTRVPAQLKKISVGDNAFDVALIVNKAATGRHEMIDHQGGHVTIVLANAAAWAEQKHHHKPDANQGQLDLEGNLRQIARSDGVKPGEGEGEGVEPGEASLEQDDLAQPDLEQQELTQGDLQQPEAGGDGGELRIEGHPINFGDLAGKGDPDAGAANDDDAGGDEKPDDAPDSTNEGGHDDHEPA